MKYLDSFYIFESSRNDNFYVDSVALEHPDFLQSLKQKSSEWEWDREKFSDVLKGIHRKSSLKINLHEDPEDEMENISLVYDAYPDLPEIKIRAFDANGNYREDGDFHKEDIESLNNFIGAIKGENLAGKRAHLSNRLINYIDAGIFKNDARYLKEKGDPRAMKRNFFNNYLRTIAEEASTFIKERAKQESKSIGVEQILNLPEVKNLERIGCERIYSKTMENNLNFKFINKLTKFNNEYEDFLVVYSNGYIRAVSDGRPRVIKKFSPLVTLDDWKNSFDYLVKYVSGQVIEGLTGVKVSGKKLSSMEDVLTVIADVYTTDINKFEKAWSSLDAEQKEKLSEIIGETQSEIEQSLKAIRGVRNRIL